MKTIILNVITMAETAVGLVSIQTTAPIVLALELLLAMEFQMLLSEMDFVTMKPTLMSVITMVETVVEYALTPIIVKIVLVLEKLLIMEFTIL